LVVDETNRKNEDENDPQVQITKSSTIQYYGTDSCDTIGTTIERIFCAQCKCKLATTTTTTTRSKDATTVAKKKWYINMGTIVDKCIRADYAGQWRTHRTSEQLDQAAAWYPAQPKYDDDGNNVPTYNFTGGCSCGNARFSITDWDVPNEIPHCYCRLCRQMSGTAFVSWIWVTPHQFQWLTKEPTLLRTTDFGQRHVCDVCGTCLTIIYDDKEDNDYIYPTAASIDHFPNIDLCLDSVTHIYCHDNAAWYMLPDDGLPRYYDE
jgi:hypothetical protein